jgi:streptogramin lyase
MAIRSNDSKLLAFAIVFALLTACSSRTQSGTFLPPSNGNASPMLLRESGGLVVRVTIARSAARGLQPAYVSPATRGMTVDISGPTSVKKTVGLTLNATGCKSSLMSVQCTLTIPLKACPSSKKCYVATVATYDAYKNGKIPKKAHKLSADQNFSFAITAGNTLIPLTLYGIPHSVVFVPSATSLLTGSMKTGFVEPKCQAANQTVGVFGVDFDGNYIVGPGAPRVALTSSDVAQFRVVKSASSPNDFVLAPPTPPVYPFGNHAVGLTTSAVPVAQSGASRITSKVIVAYSGDICGVVTEFPVPTAASGLREITTGPDGAIWFSEYDTDKIGRSTTTGTISEFLVPTPSSEPYGITAGPDGNVWFTEVAGSKIGRITTAGAIAEFPTTTGSSAPVDIAEGPDGNLWFAEGQANNIGRITTLGTMAEFGIPTSASSPANVVTGPDGNIWFTEYATDKIGVSTVGGAINDFAVTGAHPEGIAAGLDKALWIVDAGDRNILRLTTSGVQTSTYSMLTSSNARNIVSGPDGALWFAEASGKVGRVTVSGDVTEYPAGNILWGIAVGPDGAIWFTDVGANMIGRLY